MTAELTNARKVETSLKHIEEIGGVTKDIEGAVITKIEIGEHELPL